MPKMTLDLTDSLQSFVDSESSQQGFVSTDEYVLYVLQKEQDRARVRALIEEGEASPAEVISVEDYIASLRNQIAAKKDL
jgi:antitoxin ParD1/3/4